MFGERKAHVISCYLNSNTGNYYIKNQYLPKEFKKIITIRDIQFELHQISLARMTSLESRGCLDSTGAFKPPFCCVPVCNPIFAILMTISCCVFIPLLLAFVLNSALWWIGFPFFICILCLYCSNFTAMKNRKIVKSEEFQKKQLVQNFVKKLNDKSDDSSIFWESRQSGTVIVVTITYYEDISYILSAMQVLTLFLIEPEQTLKWKWRKFKSNRSKLLIRRWI